MSAITGRNYRDVYRDLVAEYRVAVSREEFDPDTPEPTSCFRRTDTDQTIEVTHHFGDVPEGGPAIGNLQQILDGSASDGQRDAFAEACHRREQVFPSDD